MAVATSTLTVPRLQTSRVANVLICCACKVEAAPNAISSSTTNWSNDFVPGRLMCFLTEQRPMIVELWIDLFARSTKPPAFPAGVIVLQGYGGNVSRTVSHGLILEGWRGC